jgi:hypothetical protein
MTTDRTLATRAAAAPTDRPSSGAAERRDGSAFAALLETHATGEPTRRPTTGREDGAPVRRDDARTAAADENGSRQPVRRDETRAAGAADDSRGADGAAAGDSNGVAGGADGPSPGHDLASHPPVATGPALGVPHAAVDLGLLGAAVVPSGQPHDLVAVGTAAIVVPPAATAPAAAAPVLGTPVSPAAPPVAISVPAAQSEIPTGAPVPASLNAAVPAPEAPASPLPAPAAAAPVASVPPAAPVVEGAQVAVAPQPVAEPDVASRVPAPAPAAAAPADAAPAAPADGQPAVTAPASQSVGTAPASGTAAPERAVPLHRAPAAVATLLHVAAERGITHAKLALRPAELGGIEIRLQASAAGIAAQVVADSPEAARLLAQAGDDLRRALEARDVTLLSLEVSTSSEQRGREGEWSDRESSDARSTPGGAPAEGEPSAPATQIVIELPGGLLVDVLA